MEKLTFTGCVMKYIRIIFSIIGGMFVLVGMVLLIASFIVNSNFNKIYDKCDSVMGQVVETNNDSRTVINYVVGGKEYTKNFSSYRSDIKEGDSIKVYYNPSNIADVNVKEFTSIINNVLNIIGGVFIGIGIIIILLVNVIIFSKKRCNKKSV